jgi:mannitol-specific phosphotransferase system IIBC component
MIRQSWALVNLAVCLLAAIAIMAPFFPYMVTQVMNVSLGQLAQLWLGMLVSAVISLVITVLFLKISLKNAEELLSKAEI